MDDHGLDEFRRRWQEELAQAQALRKRRRPRGGRAAAAAAGAGAWRGEQASGYLALAQGLLEGAGRPPAARAARQDAASRSRSPPAREGAGGGEQLVDQLIRDLNEMDDVPFFDIQLPYELAINIFQYLDRRELGRCAQVSKTWKVIAEDEVLWFRLCQQEGHLPESSISDYSCWKLIFQECRAKEHMLRTNWKNRKGAVSELEHIPDAVLCDVRSHDGVVIAGYTSGDVRVWDTRTWDYVAPFLESEYEEDEPGMQPYVSFVRINSSLAVAAYEDGFLNIWDLRTGKYPIHRFEHDARIQALALSREDATVATASAFDVIMLSPNEEGIWQITAEFEVHKLVDYLEIVPDTGRYPVAVATAGDLVYLLKADDSARTLHYVYGQLVTCLDVSANQAAFGVKSLGWVYEGNKILVYSLEAERCLSKLGNALGDFTCVNLRDSPPQPHGQWQHGQKGEDSRPTHRQIALSMSAHQLGVSAVQMDDWKIVSGGEEGLVCVWDYRMNQKLWEVHSRHPVRHVSFNRHSLITANVPYERVVRSADLDSFATHRRHRGSSMPTSLQWTSWLFRAFSPSAAHPVTPWRAVAMTWRWLSLRQYLGSSLGGAGEMGRTNVEKFKTTEELCAGFMSGGKKAIPRSLVQRHIPELPPSSVAHFPLVASWLVHLPPSSLSEGFEHLKLIKQINTSHTHPQLLSAPPVAIFPVSTPFSGAFRQPGPQASMSTRPLDLVFPAGGPPGHPLPAARLIRRTGRFPLWLLPQFISIYLYNSFINNYFAYNYVYDMCYKNYFLYSLDNHPSSKWGGSRLCREHGGEPQEHSQKPEPHSPRS